jgi:fucose 4-O-acetylase-like acetyltransferase
MSPIQRLEWVDYAKAIGIILVVYGHVARGLFSAGIIVDSPIYHYVDSVIYTFHMPLFFFLSGLFVISSFRTKGLAESLCSKLDVIIYPYIIWSLIQGCIEVFLSTYTNGSVTIDQVLSLFTSPRAQFWFLYALFLVFVISLIAIYILKSASLSVLFMLSLVAYLSPIDHDSFVGFRLISNNLIFFWLGAIFQNFRMVRFNNDALLFVVIIIFVGCQILFHGVGHTYIDRGLPLLILSTISLLLVVSLSDFLTRYDLSFISYIGASSMAIYLMHILAGSGVRVILSKFLGVDSLYVHIIMGTFLGVLIPLLALKVLRYFKLPYFFSFPISRYLLKRPVGTKHIE